MSQQYDIMKDVMNAIHAAFEPKDNGYELRRFQINGDEYCIERDVDEWNWSCGNETDNQVYPSLCEALQAAIDYAQAEIDNEAFEREEAYNDRKYGSYESQVRGTYRSVTGGDL